MPTAQDTTTTYLIEVMPGDTTQDFLSRDVDLLVSQIKENLRLSGLKAKSSTINRNRVTPYRVPSSRSSWSDSNGCDICNKQNLNDKLINGPPHQLQDGLDQQQQELIPYQPELRQQQQQQQQCCHRYHHFHHHLHHCHHHHLHCQHNHHRHHRHHRHHLHHNCSNNDREDDDPYELLQELLRGGGLIKEAVKRLKANFVEYKCTMDDKLREDDEEEEEDDVDDDEEDEEDVLEDGMVVNNGAKERSSMVYRRKPYFYDSEDEPSVYESFEL
ncbi:hypothetical protein M0802_011395 [Mischocyttarus mexicanus]|nr:hypothetical protein M0802_011395 [Mischocyttarus mexicanus]